MLASSARQSKMAIPIAITQAPFYSSPSYYDLARFKRGVYVVLSIYFIILVHITQAISSKRTSNTNRVATPLPPSHLHVGVELVPAKPLHALREKRHHPKRSTRGLRQSVWANAAKDIPPHLTTLRFFEVDIFRCSSYVSITSYWSAMRVTI